LSVKLTLNDGAVAAQYCYARRDIVGHETKSFEWCKAILVSRVFGGFRVSREYFANVSDAARVGLDGHHCKIRFLGPLLDVPT
jgi:hypothetical protein